jgi:hypothetical protein
MDLFRLNRGFWYSSFDGHYFAELLPSYSNYWYIAILGLGRIISAVHPYQENYVWDFLSEHSFQFSQVAWTSMPVVPFKQNPFLVKSPVNQVFSYCQTGFHDLPISPELNEALILSRSVSEPFLKQERLNIYFILTADQALLKIGIARKPNIALKTLQKNQAQPLLLLGFMPGTAKQVNQIQFIFPDALLQNGWFLYTPELEEYISALL